MMNNTKKWLVAATILVVVGAIMFVAAFAALGFDFERISMQF